MKPGNPIDRAAIAALVREKRCHPSPSFDRKGWRIQMHMLIANSLTRMTRARQRREGRGV